MSQDQVDLPSAEQGSAGQFRKSVALQIWLVDLTYTQQTIAADVIPGAVGGIATYTEACLGLAEPIRVSNILKHWLKLSARIFPM